VNYVAANGDAMRGLAVQFLALAEKRGTTAPLLIAHRIMGISLAVTGDIACARAHFDRTIALYDPTEHRPLATRFSVDAHVSVLCYRSWALWFLGYPKGALSGAERALSDARELGQAATVMYALYHASFTHFHCGNYATVNLLNDEHIALADEKGALLWKVVGTMHRAWELAVVGQASNSVQKFSTGLAAYRATGSNTIMPLWLSILARAHAALGQIDETRRCIGEALRAVETTKEKWHEAEVHRTAGEIELMSPKPDAAEAQICFECPLAVTRAQQAKSWELRAATSLARLWRDQGKWGEARASSRRSMAGSRKVSTRSTWGRRKLCSTRWLNRGACRRE
jgi:predicted ATPase